MCFTEESKKSPEDNKRQDVDFLARAEYRAGISKQVFRKISKYLLTGLFDCDTMYLEKILNVKWP